MQAALQYSYVHTRDYSGVGHTIWDGHIPCIRSTVSVNPAHLVTQSTVRLLHCMMTDQLILQIYIDNSNSTSKNDAVQRSVRMCGLMERLHASTELLTSMSMTT